MLINKIKSTIIGASIVLTGCSNPTSVKNIEQYMEQTNRSQKELNSIIDKTKNSTSYYVGVQSKLDSMAYRDIFMTTTANKDSAKVAEFNKIASKGRMIMIDPEKKLIETNISIKEYKQISTAKNGKNWFENIQYATDSINYRKFFKENNLLNKKTLNLFNNISKQIKP